LERYAVNVEKIEGLPLVQVHLQLYRRSERSSPHPLKLLMVKDKVRVTQSKIVRFGRTFEIKMLNIIVTVGWTNYMTGKG
jgi:hypothetical protein